MPAKRIGFLVWPSTRPLTLALLDEALRVAGRLSKESMLHCSWWAVEGGDTPLSFPGIEFAAIPANIDDFDRIIVLADEPMAQVASAAANALRQAARASIPLTAVSAGVYVLAQLGLLDGVRTAVHWRWQDDFAERFPKVIATTHLFEWEKQRVTACGGLATLDVALALLGREYGGELAGSVSEELVVERIRDGGERQRIPLRNRLGSSHPKLTQAVMLMEANIEEPLTTDEIAQHVCVSRRQLERIFKQYLNRVPSQYYLELRLNRARKLLLQTSKSIIQIGLSCGFSSGPHFSSAYRNFFGVTPRDDRNQRRASGAVEGVAAVAPER
ncbi:GlxA family transcriptional regulator [Atopomonas sediminilitoris]|uniref:GlxA family transcriptional regulator n=1 Tax=Atopomonas sediminilitoris TaxID=2919919 RepID=UPI001F4EE840|nr:GlxA family transcriptional regulator [Atopomonas sediminilitoris]MCJ8170062.1 GlxA family transcriptional regulator [Atopomonas sediminilitoris]